MPEIEFRPADPVDFTRILALNESEVCQTSPLDLARLQELDALAAYHYVAVADGKTVAFLLAMTSDAPYENANFDWFKQNVEGAFVYLDRIVIDNTCRGVGLGTHLYTHLFTWARSQKISQVTCEYNITPLNAASQAFHNKLGFKELGTQWLNNGAKRVSLQQATI